MPARSLDADLIRIQSAPKVSTPPTIEQKRRQKRPNNSRKARTGPECLAVARKSNVARAARPVFTVRFREAERPQKKNVKHGSPAKLLIVYLFIYLLSSPDSWNGRGRCKVTGCAPRNRIRARDFVHIPANVSFCLKNKNEFNKLVDR
jgi:hypothetical protein